MSLLQRLRLNIRISSKRLSSATLWVVGLSLVVVVGCSSQSEEDLKRAKGESEGGRHSAALALVERGLARVIAPEEGLGLAREGARIAFFELKKYREAIRYYEYLVLNSPDNTERIESQRQIIDILFNHLNDYKKTISEVHKYLGRSPKNDELIKYKIMLAKSYFYLSEYDQAESEVKTYLQESISNDDRYELLLMQANIANARKRPDQAALILLEMIRIYPDRAKRESLRLTLTVAYEESGQLDKAIQELQAMKKENESQEQIELRIRRLEDRKVNQPGRRGRRK